MRLKTSAAPSSPDVPSTETPPLGVTHGWSSSSMVPTAVAATGTASSDGHEAAPPSSGGRTTL